MNSLSPSSPVCVISLCVNISEARFSPPLSCVWPLSVLVFSLSLILSYLCGLWSCLWILLCFVLFDLQSYSLPVPKVTPHLVFSACFTFDILCDNEHVDGKLLRPLSLKISKSKSRMLSPWAKMSSADTPWLNAEGTSVRHRTLVFWHLVTFCVSPLHGSCCTCTAGFTGEFFNMKKQFSGVYFSHVV